MATSNTKEKVKIYVWAKTERAGDIVTVSGTDGKFTVFTDGTKCATELIGEMLIEARDENNANSLAKSFMTNTPDVANPVIEAKTTTTTQTTTEVNVMLEMLKKISSKNTITMPLQLNIPSIEVYDLFKDQMDITRADLNEQILALIESQINNLQEQLKPQAEEFIKQYYNGGKAKQPKGASSSRTNSGTNSTSSGPDITY